MKAYLVQHLRKNDSNEDDSEDVKIIGVYSSIELAQYAVQKSKFLPGFVDYPNGFYIDEYEVDVDHWDEGFIV